MEDNKLLYELANRISFNLSKKLLFFKKTNPKFSVSIVNNSIEVIVGDPSIIALSKGVRPQQMIWLKDKTIPIIVKGRFEPIFRKATEKSMAEGKWFRKGRIALNLIETSIKNAFKEVIRA